jgi:transposase
MFIREVRKQIRTEKEQYDYVQHRLVESIRTPHGPRQKVLLNLGILEIHPDQYKALANLIEAYIYRDGQQELFIGDAKLQALAQHYAELIIRKRVQESASADETDRELTPKPCYRQVDMNSTTTSDAKTVGCEHIVVEQLKELSFFKILRELGFTSSEQAEAVAQICARLIHPSSERESARWLRQSSGLDELLEADFSRMTDHRLHRIADRLLEKKALLEKKLSQKTRDLFSLEETLVLYDLTNTYLESPKRGSRMAKYGRSKEKRNDCPLVTLALVVDGQGFPKRSRVYEGNISEAKTLLAMLEDLQTAGEKSKPQTVVIDAGMATEENLRRLREDPRFEYVVISRKKKWEEDLFSQVAAKELELSRRKKLTVKLAVHGEETFLLCQSPDRRAKDAAIFQGKRQRWEQALQALQQGLEKPRTRKAYAHVVERVGRLKERYKIGLFYTVEVREKEGQAVGLTWHYHPEKKQEPGQYLIRTSLRDISEQDLSLIHRTLTMIESAFRWLKSDLGIQPNYHQYDRRMEAHVVISVLAYFVLAPILNKLEWGGRFIGYQEKRKESGHVDWEIPYGWRSVVRTMETQVRVTTSFLCKDHQRVDIRTTVESNEHQKSIYQRLKISFRPLGRIVCQEKSCK